MLKFRRNELEGVDCMVKIGTNSVPKDISIHKSIWFLQDMINGGE